VADEDVATLVVRALDVNSGLGDVVLYSFVLLIVIFRNHYFH
jgi:hypothetical protein